MESTTDQTETRVCPSCGELAPVTEFQGKPFYCQQSEGIETADDFEECEECRFWKNSEPVLP